jgi:hypothetical protein
LPASKSGLDQSGKKFSYDHGLGNGVIGGICEDTGFDAFTDDDIHVLAPLPGTHLPALLDTGPLPYAPHIGAVTVTSPLSAMLPMIIWLHDCAIHAITTLLLMLLENLHCDDA